MLNLCIRTDKSESELYLIEDQKILSEIKWEAHRKLGETIHSKIELLLNQADRKISDINKVVVYEGPGSFTGLRIGVSVANALAFSLNVPIFAGSGEGWMNIEDNLKDDTFIPIAPVYGSAPHITKQKK